MALVSVDKVNAFCELSCDALCTQHLMLHTVEREHPTRVLAAAVHASSRTIRDYILRGVRRFRPNTTMGYELEIRGGAARVYHTNALGSELTSYQGDLASFVTIIRRMRDALGNDWGPTVVSFSYKPRESMPRVETFAYSRILHGNGTSYIEFPAHLLGVPFPVCGRVLDPTTDGQDLWPLPDTLRDVITMQLTNLMPGSDLSLETVAGSLGLSARSLQRRLTEEGTGFRALVADARFETACDWLSEADRTVQDIAFDLGYSEPSNFTRAFRARAGAPPHIFRQALLCR